MILLIETKIILISACTKNAECTGTELCMNPGTTNAECGTCKSGINVQISHSSYIIT